MTTSRAAPLRILCQHEGGSCAACCGAYNFRDRSSDAERARFRRRTDKVRAAWPDVTKLAAARDELLALEKPDVLFAAVKVCPFAGYVDEGRVGCMIHPSRHPDGEDLREVVLLVISVARRIEREDQRARHDHHREAAGHDERDGEGLRFQRVQIAEEFAIEEAHGARSADMVTTRGRARSRGGRWCGC